MEPRRASGILKSIVMLRRYSVKTVEWIPHNNDVVWAFIHISPSSVHPAEVFHRFVSACHNHKTWMNTTPITRVCIVF